MIDIIEKDNIKIRTLTSNDLPILYKWLTDESVLEFYGGRDQKFTKEDIIKEYFEEDKDIATRLIIEYNNIPIGYCQVYDMIEEYYAHYHYEYKGEIVYCMDQFIGEPDYWNKGLGTKFMKMILQYLKKDLYKNKIMMVLMVLRK